MIPMIKRYEIQILLKAHHAKVDAARIAEVSLNTVERVASEPAIQTVEDLEKQAFRRIGRPKTAEPFRPLAEQLLQDEPRMFTKEVLQRARLDGYEGGRSVLYSLVATIRPHTVHTTWRVTHVSEEDLVELKKWRRSNNRTNWAKAVVVLDSQGGAELKSLNSKVEKSIRLLKRWLVAYKENGMDGLRGMEIRNVNPDKVMEMETKRDRIIEVLHESPRLHGINRASWSLGTLARAYERQYDESIGKSTISEYVRAEHYSFRKARRVLTSPTQITARS